MKSSIQKNESTFLLPFVAIGISIFLLVAGNLGGLNFLRKGISFIFEPMAYSSTSAGMSVSKYFETFSQFSDFNVEFNDLKTEILEKDIQNSQYAILLEENEALKEQVGLKDIESEYVMSKILSGGDVDSLRINVGSKDGVKVGNVASVRQMYIGIVISVDERGSLVRLPTSRSSHLKVVIVDGGAKDIEKASVLSRAVVSGSPEGIKIENVLMNADIEDGDIVVVNDDKVGNYLVLGYLVNLSDNPATSSRFGYVSSLADYDDLMTVFVQVD